MNPTYSIIIPHHNSPSLLQRLLNSIPERNDLEVIVVDDNSDEEKRAYSSRSDVKILYIDKLQTRGAGKARNEGLAVAQGKWLLFADADDFYKEGFVNVLDKYVDSSCDVVYFDADSVDSNTFKPTPGRTRTLNRIVASYASGISDEDEIRYKTHIPWNKMVRRSLIDKYNICFEEVAQGNDAMFSFLVGYYADKIDVIQQKLYVYTYTTNSITTRKKRSDELLLCGLENYFKQKQFLKKVGHSDWLRSFPHYLYFVYKLRGISGLLRVLKVFFTNVRKISRSKHKYVEITNKHPK